MARKSRRPRRRKARRHAREATEVMEAPKRRRGKRKSAKRSAAARKAARTRKRNKSHGRRPSRRRSKARRARSSTALVRAAVRKSGRKARPGTIRIVLATPKKRTTRRRKSSSPKRRKSRKSSRRRSSRMALPPMGEFMSNPLGEHPLSNPLSGGEFALALVAGTIGFVATDVLDRYIASNGAASSAAAQQAILGVPSIARIGAQVGITAAGMAGAYFVHHPMARAALQGMALGAGFHLLGQLTNTLIFGNLLSQNAAAQNLWPEVIAAEQANASAASGATGSTGSTGATGATGATGSASATATASSGATGSTGTTTTTTTGTTGYPGIGVGAPYGRLPANATRQQASYRDVGPYASTGVGACTPYQPPCVPPGSAPSNPYGGGYGSGNGASQPGPGGNGGNGCVPCGASSMQAAMGAAVNACQDDNNATDGRMNGLSGPPRFTVKPGRVEIPD